MSGPRSWNVLLALECLSSMSYPILRGVPQGEALVVLDGSILRVIIKNILYHKNIPSIIQSLGSTDYVSLFYSPIAGSITSIQYRSNSHFLMLPPIFDKVP